MVNSKMFVWAVVVAAIVLMFTALSYAGDGTFFTMPDGTQVPLDGLETYEKQELIKHLSKVADAQNTKEKVVAEASKVMADVVSDPDKLDKWRKMITGTIRDVCDDLNVSVNEFVKTPVGAGVAALIIYKVAGKEIISEVVDIVLIIPFWFIMMVVLFYLQRRYLTSITIYASKKEIPQEKGKPIIEYSDPKRATVYAWKSGDARCIFAVALYLTMLTVTITALMIAF